MCKFKVLSLSIVCHCQILLKWSINSPLSRHIMTPHVSGQAPINLKLGSLQSQVPVDCILFVTFTTQICSIFAPSSTRPNQYSSHCYRSTQNASPSTNSWSLRAGGSSAQWATQNWLGCGSSTLRLHSKKRYVWPSISLTSHLILI